MGLGAAAAGGLAVSGEAKGVRRPNILWVMTDQQPVSTLGCYGNTLNPTPNLDALAREGVRFDRFYIAAFPCSPSRASFLTGRYPQQHGITTNDIVLDPAIPTLGTLSRDAGYATAFFGKSHLNGNMYRFAEGEGPAVFGPHDGHWQFKRVENDERYVYEKVPGGVGEDGPQMGFDEWGGGWEDYRAYLRAQGLGDLLKENPVLGNHNDMPSAGDHEHAYSRLPEEHHMAAYFRKRAVDFLGKRAPGDDPFCMVVSFYGPHLPVAPPRPWDTKYSLDDVQLPANHNDDLEDKPSGQSGNLRCYRLGSWSDEQYLDYIRRYYGYCAYIDAQIGMILDALEATGEGDDTIVVFTADHGDMVGAHGMIYKLAHCGYEELMRVPFLLRYRRGIQGGKTTRRLTSSIDALPTLIDLAGLQRPDGLPGRSFAAKPGGRDGDAYAFCNIMEISFMVTDGRWKFVANVNPRCCNELYDLKRDPGEMTNLVDDGEHSATQQRLRDAIARWLRDTSHPYAERVIRDMDTPPPVQIRIHPEVTQCKYLGGRKFSFGYAWQVDAAPAFKEKYWSYCQFRNPRYGKDADIAFRLVVWPEPATQAWEDGAVVPIGPATIEIPDTAGPGEYAVHIGLYEPEKRLNPPIAPPYTGVVGTLTVAADEHGAVSDVRFTPAGEKG